MTITARPETRDPRLLKRINTSNTIMTGDIPSASVADSPNVPVSALHRNADGKNESPRFPAIPRPGQILSGSQRPPSPSVSSTAVEQQGDPTTLFITMLGSFVENVASSAVLNYEQSKIKAKVAHQAIIDKKMGHLSKTFPAFSETSIKAKAETDKDLAALDQKLAENQKAQAGFLAAVPDLLRALTTSTTSNREREQLDLVQRCMSRQEEFKSIVDDFKERLEKQTAVTSNIEEGYLKMVNKVHSLTEQVNDLSSQLESLQACNSDVDKKHTEFEDISKSLSGETRSSFAAMKIDLERCKEHGERQQSRIENATNTRDKLSTRVGVLESQHQPFSETATRHVQKLEELERFAEDLYLEIQKMKSAASSHDHISDKVRLMEREIQELRQTFSDVQSKKPSISLDAQELSALRTDIAALKQEIVNLTKDKPALQDATELNQKLLQTDGFNALLRDIAGLQATLNEKRTEEDKRDDFIAVQLEKMKQSILNAKEEIGRRIETIESDIKKQRAEDLHRAQKLQDSVAQLSKAGSQLSTSQLSPPSAPPSAPPTPQMRLPLLQAASSSPQPTMQQLPAEINRRVESVESFLPEIRQQLQALFTAYQQLDRRYNNITTQPIVRAMVHQMQMMYPYASEAQREIVNLKHMIEPLRNTVPQLEGLTTVVNNHTTTFASIPDFETRIKALERERAKTDARQEKVVEHVKEERAKLVDEVNSQKETTDAIARRLDDLEGHRKDEPDKLEYLIEKLATKLRAESTKTMQDLTQRLDSLEADSRRQDLFDSKRQDLLEAFTGKTPAHKIGDRLLDLQDEETDDSSIPLAVKTNGQISKAPPSSAPSGLGKTFLKTRTNSTPKKRKRFGSQENNDRSDDDTYAPTVQSSPARRKLRGSQ
jgi:DNA repair exonuclease SbcCD ATPase subunit